MIRSAPCSRQPGDRPEPDHARRRRRRRSSPRGPCAVLIAAPSPVESPQANRAAPSSGASGLDLGERDLRHHRVLGEGRGAHEVADLARRRGAAAWCRRAGSPCSAARGSPGRGWCGRRRQWTHSPHWGENSVTTWSPARPAVDVRADRLDHAGALVPEHGRRVAGGVDAGGRVEVGVADAAGHEPDQRPRRCFGSVQLELLDDQRLAELLQDRRAHPHLGPSSVAVGPIVCPRRHPQATAATELPSSSTRATSSGSSQVGVWPQPSRTTKRAPGGRALRLAAARPGGRRSPQAIVTGTSAGNPARVEDVGCASRRWPPS